MRPPALGRRDEGQQSQRRDPNSRRDNEPGGDDEHDDGDAGGDERVGPQSPVVHSGSLRKIGRGRCLRTAKT